MIPTSWCIHSYGVPALILTGLLNPAESCRSDGMSCPRLGYKRHCSFSPGCTYILSWVTHPVANQPLWEGRGNEELRSFATHQGGRASQQPHEWAILEVDLQGPSTLKITADPAHSLSVLSPDVLSHTTKLSHSQIPGPQQLHTITKVCCKWIKFWVICYAAIDN